jgi:hypothetical protein
MIVIVVAVLFGIVAVVVALAAMYERSGVRPARVGDPPPAAGTPRDRWNKRLTVTGVAGLICHGVYRLGLGR